MRTRWIIAGILIAIGAVWIGQGLGLLGRSGLMDGDIRWAVIGLGLIVVGFLVGWTAFRRRSQV